ncbi:MAG: TrkH family potassium uptake protein [Planctomycetes bacterium]|nr:TrkH family potassium uptake protein [Planctomycetota bacterium]MCC7398876.1 TrkH family potassium uptake protein [Planctomycetota bacterium]
MNFARVSKVLAAFVFLFSLAQAGPLILALNEPPTPDVHPVAGLGWSMGIGLAVATLLGLAGRKAPPEFFRRETICVAGIAWFLASMLGAIPFQWSGLLPDSADAMFESTSGLTTCGGTVLGTAGYPTPELTPPSLLLWRALLQWLGGIGIVLIFVSLMPSMGVASKQLLTAESVGVNSEGYQPRIRSQARGVALVYLSLTAACTSLLMLIGSMNFFEAICHAFTAMATGGFSTRSNVGLFHDLGVEVVLTVFMFLGGMSFVAMAAAARDGWRGCRDLMRGGELRLYTTFTVLAIAIVTVELMRAGLPFGEALRQSSFNVVSMLSCCGYATSDFHAWPALCLIVIWTCTIVGGCTGSAAGGFKQVRLLVCIRLLAYSLRQFVRPKMVERLRLDGEVLSASTISSILSVVLLWLLTVLVGGMVLALDQRLSFIGALSASASMLGNCGPAMVMVDPSFAGHLTVIGESVPALGPNIGPLGGYGELHGTTKLVMCFQMVLGRLELLTLLALFTPSFWRR